MINNSSQSTTDARHSNGTATHPFSAVPVARSASRPPNALNQSGITLGLVRFALSRWWRVAIPLGMVLAVVGATAVACKYPATYRGAAWLKIESQRPSLVFEEKDSPLFVRTQVELIRSPLVLGPVLKNPEVARLPEIIAASSATEWLARRVTVSSVGGSELYQIAFNTSRPANAPTIVNAILDSYLKVQSEMVDMQTQRTVELLEQELDRRGMELKRLQENLKVVAQQVTGRDPATAREAKEGSFVSATQSPLIAMMERLSSAEVERNILEAEQSALQELLAQQHDAVGPQEIEHALENAPKVVALKAELEQLRKRLREAEAFPGYGSNHPTIVRLKALVESSEKELLAAREEAQANLPEELERQRRTAREMTVTALTGRVATQRALENLLREQVAREQEQLRSLGDHTLEFEFARADVLRAEMVFQKIGDRVTAIKTELRAPPRIFPLKRCTDADVQLDKSPYSKVVMVGLGLLVAPFALAVLWEARIRRIVNSDQISDETQLPVIAEVSTYPMRPVMAKPHYNERYDRERACFEESIDLLRTSVTMPDQWKDLQIFSVASAVSGEGKTCIASQLAVSLARSSRERVLLIDADMRSPDIHGMFDVRLSPGLADVLDQRIDPREAIVTQWSEFVHILPAGRLHRNPHVLLTTKSLSRLLDQVRDEYRYVVIDAPPLLAASEAFVIAKLADGTLLCTMRDVSRGSQVRFACERLRAAGANTLGMVLSGVPTRDYNSRYGMYEYAKSTALREKSAAEQPN